MCEKCAKLEQALIAFTKAPLKGPVGVALISNNVSDMSPMQVTVTKAQFKDALSLVSQVQPNN